MKHLHLQPVHTACISLGFDILYAAYNAVLGFTLKSEWFFCAAAYYTALSVMRFCAVKYGNSATDASQEYFIMRFCGYMLVLLSLILSVSVLLTVRQEIATSYHEIIMITIATYTFTKLSFAIINLVKSIKTACPFTVTLRNISFADGIVSIFSLQKSMLVSFGAMDIATIALFNSLTGAGVCLAVFITGIYMIRKDFNKMSKSKLVEINEKNQQHRSLRIQENRKRCGGRLHQNRRQIRG